jgi:hypothetical protein
MSSIEKETFNRLVKHPYEISPEIIPQLEATIKAFPYCQISYSLLARASGLLSQEKLNENKPRAAAYALSRVALQQLVESNLERHDPSHLENKAPVAETTNLVPQDSEDIIIELVTPDPELAQIEKSEEQRRQQKIIQGFIKSNPRISSLKAESNVEAPQMNLASRVAQDGLSPIETEAFAKILVKQGKIEKAVDIYQKLILKKPEKKNYFAKKLSELYQAQK